MTPAQYLKTRIVTLAATATTLVATATGTVLADPTGGGHMWGDGWMAGSGWMGLWGVLWMVLLIAIPLALVYLMVNRREPRQRTDPAVATLRERYARGEIDDEEFETLRAKLSRRSDTGVN